MANSNAQFLSDLSAFERSINGCREVLGEGTLLVAPLPDCAEIPICYEITAPTGAAISDTTIDLQVTAPAGTQEVDLFEGRLIYMSGGEILTVTEAAVINDAGVTPVSVEALTVGVAAAETADAFNSNEVCSISSMPISLNIQTQNNKTLKDGIQGTVTKTSIQPQLNIEFFLRTDDDGFWNEGLIYDSGHEDLRFYGMSIRLNGRQTYWGPMEVTALDFADQVEQLQTGTATITLQPRWYEAKEFSRLTTAQQTALNNIRQLFGLSQLV